ncbi:hypothetical protein GH890_32875, partial [Bacillus thuringiensis]|nr:hypothetical protein [Bacillus thuringiensis]
VHVSANCVDCICKVANAAPLGYGTGPCRISWPFWSYCGKPGTNHALCANNIHCSKKCVMDYVNRHVTANKKTCEQY